MALAIVSGCGKAPPPVQVDMRRAVALRADLEAGAAAPASADATPSETPTGWATLKGSFKINGSAPERKPQAVDKEREVCAPGGKTPLSEEIVVGPDGGIRDVVIFLASAIPDDEPWTHPDAKPGKTGEVLFDQKGCQFLTHVLALQPTQLLRIKNSDPVGHNTSLKPKKNRQDDQTVASGSTTAYQAKAEEADPFPVSCAIHPWMKAWLVLRKNSYVAVTKEDGSFEIPNLPANVNLEFRVWQEKTNYVQAVAVNGQPQKWAKGKFKLKLEPDSTQELNVSIDSGLFTK
jgi:plastocyanin